MAIDTLQRLMSDILPRMPWRGPSVDASEPVFDDGNIRAAAVDYSGVAPQTLVPTPLT